MNKITSKKATWGWEMVGKLILLLIIILVLITIVFFLSGKTNIVWEKLKSIMTFRL
ncbi:MAG: hypothetical protein ABIJ08_00530 [Nanoarchaeota archaeon]